MNDILRIKCKYLIETYGSSQSFIASKCGVTRSSISMWLLNKRELSNETLSRMNQWLDSLN